MLLRTSGGTSVRVTEPERLVKMVPVLQPFVAKQEVSLLQDFPAWAVEKAVEYCRAYDYNKQTNNIPFPLLSNKI